MDEHFVDGWNSHNTKQLLELYNENKEKFRNPKIKNKKIWDEMGQKMKKTGDELDKKFRNLKQTYMRILQKKKQTGEGAVQYWSHFNIFEEIFEMDHNINPEQKSTIISSLPGCSKTTELRKTSTDSEVLKPVVQRSNTMSRKRKYEDIRQLSSEMTKRQEKIESKLDSLIETIVDSNNIQRNRNELIKEKNDLLKTLINKNSNV